MGTLWRTQVSTSCARRSFDLCTIWFTAYGATIAPGLALRCSSSVVSISVSQVSSASCGRALSAGNDPTTPALHCSITSFGLLAMNIGEQITGSDRPWRIFGRDIR